MFATALEEPAEVEEHLREMACEAESQLRRTCRLAGEIALKLTVEGVGNREQGIGNRPDRPGFAIPDASSRICDPLTVFHFSFKRPTDSACTMLHALVKMLNEKMEPGMEVSGVQVVLSDLVKGNDFQLCLIGRDEMKGRLDAVVEQIRDRFGDGSVFPASSLAPTGRARTLSRIAA